MHRRDQIQRRLGSKSQLTSIVPLLEKILIEREPTEHMPDQWANLLRHGRLHDEADTRCSKTNLRPASCCEMHMFANISTFVNALSRAAIENGVFCSGGLITPLVARHGHMALPSRLQPPRRPLARGRRKDLGHIVDGLATRIKVHHHSLPWLICLILSSTVKFCFSGGRFMCVTASPSPSIFWSSA